MIIKAPLSFPNLHFQQLRKVCHTKPAILAKQYGLEEFNTPKGNYWFKDNNADILAVAHVDSVLPFLHFDVTRLRPDTLIYCSTLDDRLGVYIILDWLDKSGAKYDILLTENEEKGESTARWFKPPEGKKYNWTFSFDRKGEDVATYQYYSVGFASAIMKHGAESVVHGTYSDIVELEHLGCRGLNFGIGFHNEHSQYAYAHKSEILFGLRRFQSFYREYVSQAFPFETEKTFTSAKANIKKNSAKEHRKLVGKATEQLKKEFKERKRIEEIADRPNVQAIEAILQQNVSFLHLLPGTISTLYENEIYLVQDLVKNSRIELLKLDGVTKVIIDEIEKILPPIGLSFAMSLQAYHLPIVSMNIVKREDKDPSGKVHHNIILALPSVQKQGKVYGGISLTPGKKSLVSHPKAPVLSTTKIRGSEDIQITLMECPQCYTMYDEEQIDKDSQLCITCTAERKKAGLDKALPDCNCVKCGNVYSMEDLDDSLTCIKCLEELENDSKKVKDSTEEKGATIMRAAFKLNRDVRDTTKFALTKDGFHWVSISPIQTLKVPAGFRPEPGV